MEQALPVLYLHFYIGEGNYYVTLITMFSFVACARFLLTKQPHLYSTAPQYPHPHVCSSPSIIIHGWTVLELGSSRRLREAVSAMA